MHAVDLHFDHQRHRNGISAQRREFYLFAQKVAASPDRLAKIACIDRPDGQT
jgi:hypothetical protein